MPGIIDLQTNLRGLPYSAGKQPYIRTPLPAYEDPNPTTYVGRDIVSRNGILTAATTDLERITAWGLDGTGGLIFLAKQEALALSGVKTLALAPQRVYNPANTLAQIGGNSVPGLHFVKDGVFPDVDPTETYEYQLRNVYNGDGGGLNRLTALKSIKLNQTPNPLAAQIQIDVTNEGALLSYLGGPGSVAGLGTTTIKRYTNTEEWVERNNPNGGIMALTYGQLETRSNETRNKGTGIAANGNFLVFLKDNSSVNTQTKNRRLGKLTNYSFFNRNKTYGTGEIGNGDELNRETYYDGESFPTKGTDLVNYTSIYKSDQFKTGKSAFEAYDDIIKFNFGVLDNNDPSQKTYVHLRAYLTQFSDSHQAQWNSFKYMGRGENFYRYEGYDRSISIGFRVYVHSRAELFPVYKKLNYLASIMAPDYSTNGFMRGNIVYLTIGDYIVNVPGVMENIEYQIPEDSTWDIARDFEGKVDPNSAELPMLVDASFNFKPIHNFLPRTALDPNNPEQNFISKLKPTAG
jgi:hypothetical protein